MRNSVKWCAALAAVGTCTAVTSANEPILLNDGAITVTPAGDVTPFDQILPAGCADVYRNFDEPSDPPNYGTGWTISAGFVGCWGPGSKISVASDTTLCEIMVSATHVTGTNAYEVALWEDGGSVPGAMIASWDFTNIPQNQAGPTPLLVADASDICLEAGDYWLSFRTFGADSWGVLRWSSAGTSPLTSANYGCGGPWASSGSRDPGAWIVTGTDGCGGGGLTLIGEGDCPGRYSATARGATAGGPVAFLRSNSAGSFVIPGGACAGTQTGLGAPVTLVQIVNADANGLATVSGNVPAAACGVINVQAIDGTTCATSNVIVIN